MHATTSCIETIISKKQQRSFDGTAVSILKKLLLGHWQTWFRIAMGTLTVVGSAVKRDTLRHSSWTPQQIFP